MFLFFFFCFFFFCFFFFLVVWFLFFSFSLFGAWLFSISTLKRIIFSYLVVCIFSSLLQVKWSSEYVIIDTHTLPRCGCSSLFPYTATTEIRDESTVALSCCTRSLMTLSQSQPPIISHQTVDSPATFTLCHTDRFPHSRTTINAPSFPEPSYTGMPSQPSYHCFLTWHNLVMLCTRKCICPP